MKLIEISRRELTGAERITEDMTEKTCSDMGGARRGGEAGRNEVVEANHRTPNCLADNGAHL